MYGLPLTGLSILAYGAVGLAALGSGLALKLLGRKR